MSEAGRQRNTKAPFEKAEAAERTIDVGSTTTRRGSLVEYPNSIERLLMVIANAAIILGIGIALAGLWQNNRSDRAAASLAYVETFSQGQILEARNNIYRGFLGVQLGQLPSEGMSAEAREALMDALFATQPEPGELEVSIVNLVDYYDGVAACMRTSICDPVIAMNQLGDYARQLACFFSPYITEVRTQARLSYSPIIGQFSA